MIHILNALSIDGKTINLTIPSHQEIEINAAGLTLLPGLIDPHVHFRTPGMEYKEDWRTAATAAIHGGYTTVFDMPNTLPPTNTLQHLNEKKKLIDQQLQEVGIPLRYQLFFGADKHHLSEIYKTKGKVIGVKIFMGCSTGNLVIDDDESLHAVFAIAATQNMLVAVHAEDEKNLQVRKSQFKDSHQYNTHSKIRDIETAVIAVEKAIALARTYHTHLYILHVSTAEELHLIREAKKSGLPVFAETTPHHLFLNEENYNHLHGKAVVNPPLRNKSQHDALWQAIHDQTIDTIGSDHAPHTESEKSKPYGECPSGMPGIETTLALLLNAYHEHHLSLQEIVKLTSARTQEIFGLAKNDDIILVDLEKQQEVLASKLHTKCGWSPFTGYKLRGWPVYTIVRGHCFKLT